MNLVFPALESRFKGSAPLKLAGRKLYLGLGGLKKTLPYVSVGRVTSVPETSFGKDFETYTLQFNGFTSREHHAKVLDLMDLVQETYDKCDLLGAGFSTVGMLRQGTTGPLIADGVYQFTMLYELQIERTVNVPLSRLT